MQRPRSIERPFPQCYLSPFSRQLSPRLHHSALVLFPPGPDTVRQSKINHNIPTNAGMSMTDSGDYLSTSSGRTHEGRGSSSALVTGSSYCHTGYRSRQTTQPYPLQPEASTGTPKNIVKGVTEPVPQDYCFKSIP